MKIYQRLDEFIRLDYAVVTSGTFDGLHKGHQKILNRVQEIARQHNGESVIITYWPHPRLVLQKGDSGLKLLSTFEEKAELLNRQGIDHLICIPFTPEFSQLSSQDFIQQILVERIGTKKLVIGYDHRFGKNREGSFEHLVKHAPEYGFDVEEISRQDVDNIGVSSTKIRFALEDGDIDLANEFLSRPYRISGTVVEGNKIGRELGFPTANIKVNDPYKLVPGDGAYAVRVNHKRKVFKGMLNIGFRPTIQGMDKAIEVNIFDLNEELYGQELSIDFIKLLRKEIKFKNLEELRQQLLRDQSLASKILSE